MARRNPSPQGMMNASLILTLMDGTTVGPADTTAQPFGDNENLVAVWQGDRVVLYPLCNVAKIEIVFE